METNPNDPATGYGYTTADGSSRQDQSGLTKREQFAALAMQGILSNSEGGMTESGYRAHSPESVSNLAIMHADALIEALNK